MLCLGARPRYNLVVDEDVKKPTKQKKTKPIFCILWDRYKNMGGRLPAVVGMPANRTFLELCAGQSDWPEKNCVVLLPKKRRRPVSFRHEEKRFSLWTAPCLSIKRGVYRVTYIFRLPSLINLWPLHKPTSDLVETRQPIKEHNIVPEKAGVKMSMNTAADGIQWRAYTAAVC